MPSKALGFSLIEVVIAMLLITLATFGLARLQLEIEQRSEFARDSQVALQLMESKLVWLATRGAQTALSSLAVADFELDVVTGSDVSDSRYTLSWQVDSALLDGSLKPIEIHAQWLDRHGQTQSITLRTMLSQFNEFEP